MGPDADSGPGLPDTTNPPGWATARAPSVNLLLTILILSLLTNACRSAGLKDITITTFHIWIPTFTAVS